MSRCPNCGWNSDASGADAGRDECPLCGEALVAAGEAGAESAGASGGGPRGAGRGAAGGGAAPGGSSVGGAAGPASAHSSGIALPQDVRNWAMGVHLSALSAFIIGIGFILGPLVVWLVKRQDHPFIDAHGKDAVNFNLSVLVYAVISTILIVVGIGLFLLAALGIGWLVLTIVAAVKASSGETFRYPLTIRFLA